MKYEEFMHENIRLVMLQLLNEDRGGSINERMMQKALAMRGYDLNDAELRDQFLFLEKERAIDIERIDNGALWVAFLKYRGEQHLDRLDLIEGVARPSRR